jgi:general secretion pathway protein J
MNSNRGFTLLEVLVTLLISTLLFTLLAAALHQVMSVQSRVEERAAVLHDLQQTNLFLSHDLSKAMAHVMEAPDEKNKPFVGSSTTFTLMRSGSSIDTEAHESISLTAVQYALSKSGLSRKTWSAVDNGAERYAHARQLLSHITEGHFEYLDATNHFHATWPLTEGKAEPLPRAVRVVLTLSGWGVMSALYPIPSGTYAAQSS